MLLAKKTQEFIQVHVDRVVSWMSTMSDLRFWLMNLVEFSVLFFLFVRGATVSSKMMPQSVRETAPGYRSADTAAFPVFNGDGV